MCITAVFMTTVCPTPLQGEIPEGKLPYYNLPVFNYYKGYLTTSYNATYYELAQRHAEVPRLSALQEEAIKHFNALARVRCKCFSMDECADRSVSSISGQFRIVGNI